MIVATAVLYPYFLICMRCIIDKEMMMGINLHDFISSEAVKIIYVLTVCIIDLAVLREWNINYVVIIFVRCE